MILLLEFLLIEDLNGKDARLVHGEVEALIPVRVEGAFGNSRRFCLLAIDGGDRERIREACND